MASDANERRNARSDLQLAGVDPLAARRRAAAVAGRGLRVHAADVAAPKPLRGHAGDR